jgi:hypothetical protein
VLEVHQSQNTGRLWYNTGVINGSKITWNKNDDFADGSDPAVSLNNKGQAIVAYTRNNIVYYRLLTTDGQSVDIQAEHNVADGASQPSVAATDEDWFVLCFNQSSSLMQRVGVIDGTTVSWQGALKFDDGADPSVAAQNGLAVQVHVSQNHSDQYFSTSIITDRSRWMSDRTVLYTVPLRRQILPGSHDAGMYSGGDAGQTQDKSIYHQLMYGIRWFDLRVAYLGYEVYDDLYIHHGETFGPPLVEVLEDIRKFKEQGASREVIILKFSHFGSETGGEFTTSQYNQMVKYIDDKIGPWLYKGPLPPGKRLADLTPNDFDNKVLVVVDGHWAKEYPKPGLWIYRNATSSSVAEGDLRVYDEYSNKDSYEAMKSDQLDKFARYDGRCEGDRNVSNDLYVLSWTVTPTFPDTVWDKCRAPNEHLGDEVGKMPPTNSYGQIINVVYADYTQYARPSDVAIAQPDDGVAFG